MAKTVDFDTTTSSPKQCIFEFQSFIGNSNEFIVKELCIVDIDTNIMAYFLFKPPYSFKRLSGKAVRTNKWLIKNYHHISCNEGFINYTELDNIVKHYCSKYSLIYTTGCKKANWIQQYTTTTVINFPLRRDFSESVCEGMCVTVQDVEHQTSNCALLKSYKLLCAMGKTENSGGGNAYKSDTDTKTYHEFYSNLQ